MRNQALRMRRRTNESYVWIYYPNRVVCVPAIRATYPDLPNDFESQDSMSIGELLTEGLDCERGDEQYGLPIAPTAIPMTVRGALEAMMEKLSAKNAVSLTYRRR